MGCKFSSWLIPSLVCGAAILLCFTLSCYILKTVKRASNEILQDRQWRLVTSQPIDKRVAKLFKIATLAEKKYSNEVQNILKIEIDTHQNEGEAICYLKVDQIFSITFYKSYSAHLHLSLLSLGLIGSCGIWKLSRYSCTYICLENKNGSSQGIT